MTFTMRILMVQVVHVALHTEEVSIYVQEGGRVNTAFNYK